MRGLESILWVEYGAVSVSGDISLGVNGEIQTPNRCAFSLE